MVFKLCDDCRGPTYETDNKLCTHCFKQPKVPDDTLCKTCQEEEEKVNHSKQMNYPQSLDDIDEEAYQRALAEGEVEVKKKAPKKSELLVVT